MATVQTAGDAYRLKKHIVMAEFNRAGGRRAGALQNLLLRYTQALMTQISQTAVCNRHHSIEQQLCRWLLLTVDRLPSSELTITQELIAGMLGVRREGITEAAGKLQKAGLISYRRGHITVLRRQRFGVRHLRVLSGGQAGVSALAQQCTDAELKDQLCTPPPPAYHRRRRFSASAPCHENAA